jgi:MFS family permease
MTAEPFSYRFRSLRNPRFRVFFIAQSLSSIGSFAQILAQSWLVLELSDSGTALGVVTALQFAPLLFLGPIGGVIADRFDNRKLLIATSSLAGLNALGLAVLVSTGHATLWRVAGFALAFGLILPFERPAAQSILFELCGPTDLTGAVALNALLQPVSRLLGSAVAGILIRAIGLSSCFAVNAGSYLIVVVALAWLLGQKMFARRTMSGRKGQLREGLQYARNTPVVRRTLLLMFVIGLCAYNFGTTVPAIVKFHFHSGAGGLAFVQSVTALGAVGAGIIVAGVREPSVRKMSFAAAAFGGAMVAWAFVPTLVGWSLFGMLVGCGSTAFTMLVQTVLQRESDPAMLGRVMSLFSLAFFGTTPLGALLAGILISTLDARWPFLIGGLVTLAIAIFALLRPIPTPLVPPLPSPA